MNHDSTTPEEAADAVARWGRDPELVRQDLLDDLARRGVDTTGLTWLSSEETRSREQRWIDQGAQRYGRFALIPAANVHRGEFRDGDLPPWLDVNARSQEVVLSFSRPVPGGRRRMARCEFGFVVDNLVALARSDGDGFGAFTPDLGGVLLVNVEERLGDSALDFDAWGAFIRGAG